MTRGGGRGGERHREVGGREEGWRKHGAKGVGIGRGRGKIQRFKMFELTFREVKVGGGGRVLVSLQLSSSTPVAAIIDAPITRCRIFSIARDPNSSTSSSICMECLVCILPASTLVCRATTRLAGISGRSAPGVEGSEDGAGAGVDDQNLVSVRISHKQMGSPEVTRAQGSWMVMGFDVMRLRGAQCAAHFNAIVMSRGQAWLGQCRYYMSARET